MTPWPTRFADDADDELDEGGGEGCVCHHGIGFDEDCEWCWLEDAEERAQERKNAKAAAQPDLFPSAARVAEE